MTAFINKHYALRFCFAITVLAIIAYMFWTSSRYPALDDKALMAGSIQLEDPLSFEAYITVEAQFPLWKKIIYTTINWLHTNRQGMLFGVMMGAAFLTLMRYLQRLSFRSGFLNSVLGLFLGAPLGVCVNCAAPIAKGMYSGGARAETALAAMVSSPTLNIVVLTMTFSILPFYLAAAKLGLSIALILVAIPLIGYFLPNDQRELPASEQTVCQLPPAGTENQVEPLGKAFAGFIKDALTDLWFIIRITVPLMVLAGFLGAVVATLVPLDLLNAVAFRFGIVVLVAMIGTFLPVPMAFDVVICGALLAGGLGVGYVMVLLFTLGIFSIYSFFIVAQSISLRAAGMMTIAVVTLGVFSGLGANQWHKVQSAKALELLTVDGGDGPATVSTHTVMKPKPITSNAQKALQKIESKIVIESTPFAPRSTPGELPFNHIEAHQIGIDQGIEFSFKDMWPPYWEGRSISAGDIDKDGDTDILIASTRQGLYLYINDGKGQFTSRAIGIPKIESLPIFNAVLVDINNDGWLDIFMATYKSGNFIQVSEAGEFNANGLTPVQKRGDEILALALSFGDVDKDGDLDVALGNWAAGWYRRIPGEESRNRLIFNQEGQLSGESFTDLPGLPGETLSILLSDLNQDGNLDLLTGNDFEQPDVYYYGNGDGTFNRITRNDGIFPFTTTTTMALKTGDLDNDAIPELYMAQIAGRSSGVSDRLNMRDIGLYCSSITRAADKQICQKNMDIKRWYKSGNNFDPSYADKCETLDGKYREECKAMLVKDLAIQAQDPSICDFIQDSQSEAKAFCKVHFLPPRYPSEAEIVENFPQIKDRNVLMSANPNGTFRDTSIAQGLEVGGWSWDTKFADLDNDTWQDVYIVNGTWVPNEVTPSNLFFHNQGQGKFAEKAEEFGLDDYLITAAAVTIDLENDGDLDVISVPVNGPIQSFINNSQNGNAIKIQIRDSLGNHYGIGTRLEIRYGPNGELRQMREIQMGGGFQSFDSTDVHFGLGEHDTVSEVRLRWADGQESILTDHLTAGATYQISRRALD